MGATKQSKTERPVISGLNVWSALWFSPHDKRIGAPHIDEMRFLGSPKTAEFGRGYRVPQIYLRASLAQLLQRRQRR